MTNKRDVRHKKFFDWKIKIKKCSNLYKVSIEQKSKINKALTAGTVDSLDMIANRDSKVKT